MTTAPEQAMLKTLTHHRFTIDDYHRMIDSAILTENDRVELIRGEIIDKMPSGDPHIACVNRLNRLLTVRLGEDAIVSIQNPIAIRESEPEPDVAILRPRADFYATDRAKSADILLLIEVAETSIDYDREIKGSLYAESGIVEYWIVNLRENVVEIFREPMPDGSYAQTSSAAAGERIELVAVPGTFVSVADFIPKA